MLGKLVCARTFWGEILGVRTFWGDILGKRGYPGISAIQVDDSMVLPNAKTGDCLFTCHAAACPLDGDLKYEWSIYNTVMPSYSSGNVQDDKTMYLLNASDCWDLQKKMVRERREGGYHVACRVTAQGQTKEKVGLLYNLLEYFSFN